MEELVSVIVPVYQVRRYLPECVESLLGQSYRNLELILIDDGSTDGSGELCEEYAQKDERIKVVHQTHCGVSGARNKGFQMAKGEYIAFVDSDDRVSSSFIAVLYQLIQRYNADVSVCAYERRKEGGVQKKLVKENTYSITSEQMLQEWHGVRKGLETVLWNKLYRRGLFGKEDDFILFPEGKEHEDTCVSHLLIQRAETIAFTNQILYMYRIRKGSITESSATVKKIRQDLEAQCLRIEFFEKQGFEASRDRVIIGLLLHIVMYEWKMCGKTEKVEKELGELFQKYYPKLRNSSELKGKEKVILKMASLTSLNRF